MPKIDLFSRRSAVLIAVIVVYLCCSIPCFSDASSATLSVTVTDSSGALVPGATLVLRSASTGLEQRVTTEKRGSVTFPFLKPGRYQVTITKASFADILVDSLTLNVGDDKQLHIVLKLGSTQEAITVDGSGLTINTTDASVSTVIDRTFVENMPLNGRSFQSLLTLAPGVNQVPTYAGSNSVGYSGDIVVNGQRTESNYFTVDGVSANTGTQPGLFGGGGGNAGTLPGLTALGSTQSLVSIDALQEFRSSTSTYSAEYGRSPGGNFAFNTRSGTNTFHGTAFDYFRNDALDANNWFNNHLGQTKTRERQNDFGGTLGGPLLWAGRHPISPATHFFFSYEGLRLRSPQAAQQVVVPNDSLRLQAPAALQPVLNAFPRVNGGNSPYLGFGYYIESVSYPSTLDNASIRLDRTLGSRLTVFGRYAHSPSSTTTYNNAIQQSTDLYNRSLTLGSTYMVSQHQSNEFRFNLTGSGGRSRTTSTGLGGATPFNLSSIPGPNGAFPQSGQLYVTFTYAGFTNLSLQNLPSDQHQFNITDTHTWSIGRHNLKAGVDWRRLATTVQPYSVSETVAYSSYQQVLNNAPYTAYSQIQSQGNIEPIYKNLSFFLQDEWKLSQRLSLSIGWRWDINPAPTNGLGSQPYTLDQIQDLSIAKLAPQGTPLWQTDWAGHAPRFGLAYIVHNDPSRLTVIRAGVGMFYDQGNILGANGYSGIGFANRVVYSNASFPLTTAQLAVPAASTQLPYSQGIYAFDPHLRLPYATDYNMAIEQGFSRHDSLSISYVGSQSHRLLTNFTVYPSRLGNTNFASNGIVDLVQGRASSNYNSLQLKYQRDLANGVQLLASYTWSHAADNASSNFTVYKLLRADSNYDIRHSFQAALTYQPTVRVSSPLTKQIANGWALDLRVQARTALPIDIIGSQSLDSASGVYSQYEPNLVPGQPLYVYGPTSQYPGGRAINYNAFVASPAGTQGNAPRNGVRGFGTLEFDPAVRRDFALSDKLRLQFRAEAFNIANHPSFGTIYSNLSNGASLFGRAYTTLNNVGTNLNSLYQPGGPRSIQLSMKLHF